MVFVEGAAAFVHVGMLFPGLGNHHHHGVGQRIARHDQQFQTVVEGGRVGLAFVHNGVELFQVVAQYGRLHDPFAGTQPVEVAFHRIDFTVVGDHAVRVSQRPGGEGIGGKALVYQRQGGNGTRVGQVAVVQANLVGQQQTFVHHRTHRDGRDEVFLAVRQLHAIDGVAGGFTNNVQFAFQCVGHHDVGATANEKLANDGLDGFYRRRHGHFGIDGDVAPAQNDLAFVAHRAFQFTFTGQARSGFLGQEHHGHTVFAGWGQINALGGQFFAVQGVGDLNKNTRTVAHELVGPNGAAVVEVFQNFQALLNDGVRGLAFNVGDKAHTTGVVFMNGVVQALCTGQADAGSIDSHFLSDRLCRMVGHRKTPVFPHGFRGEGLEINAFSGAWQVFLIGVRPQLNSIG